MDIADPALYAVDCSERTVPAVLLPVSVDGLAVAEWLRTQGARSVSHTIEAPGVRAYYLPAGWTIFPAEENGAVNWGQEPQLTGGRVLVDAQNRARVGMRLRSGLQGPGALMIRRLPRFAFLTETVEGTYRAFVTDGGHDNVFSASFTLTHEFAHDMPRRDRMRARVSAWFKDNRPDYRNADAYWDE